MPTESPRLAPPPADAGLAARRRVPTQERSRRRVERILDAAAELVCARGVEQVTTRDIALASGVPVASLYQYFADKDEVFLALIERDMAEMDAQVLADVAALEADLTAAGEAVTVATLVRTIMSAFVAVYHRRPAFVQIYLRGRTNPAVHAYGRRHNEQIAATLTGYARQTGLAGPELTDRKAQLAVEVGDRVFQLAFEHDDHGDPELVEEGITLVTAYLERYAASPHAR
ncbi:TetR/AcrR family transcriptional regulator [Nocardioides ferulae]|uniref:TetR/AcrR family transcriptional regulator n=1 Tax=Nocardioides ferulae TaxID=2340821 RepID=UPI0013DE538C|nr:TetR/AcrR family transcriptional regulator [Nocardioides ferulae]